MKPSRLLLSVTTLTLALLFTFAVTIATASSKPPPKKGATPAAPADTRKLIQSVDAAASTVVIQNLRDKSTHSYKIDDITVLKVNNVKGTISQVKVGMVVEDFVERDNQSLDSISLSGYGTEPAAAAAAAPKKKK